MIGELDADTLGGTERETGGSGPVCDPRGFDAGRSSVPAMVRPVDRGAPA